MPTKLEPCPFCGNQKTISEIKDDGYTIQVQCGICGAIGPQYNRRGGAIEAWNRRAK